MFDFSTVSLVHSDTEKSLALLKGEAAASFINTLAAGYTAEQMSAKLASLEWDAVEHKGESILVIYI